MIRISRRSPAAPGVIAVAIHDVEPANFERCALIRDWLDDHGITRATLLVVVARAGQPSPDSCGRLVDWLDERRRAGDWIAWHGSPDVAMRASRRRGATVLRLDLHPADLERRQNVAAVEAVLRSASGRRAVTLAEIAAVG